jgi:Ca2+-binding RTX toxin-like protein
VGESVEDPGHPVENPEDPVEDPGHPVEDPEDPVEDPEEPVEEPEEPEPPAEEPEPAVPTPTYDLTADVAAVDEGRTVRITLTTTHVPEGTAVAYTLSGISAQDLASGSLTGNLMVGADGKAYIDVALKADALTEGVETLKVELVNGKDSVEVTVNDTSLTPAQGPRVLEGTDSNDVLTGHDGADTIYGRKGDDIIRGLGSNTSLSDHLHGNEGNDIFEFRNVNELRTTMVHGQEGFDTIRLLDGFNTVADLDFKNNTSFTGQTANVSTVERLELQATGAVNVTLGTYASGIFGSNGDDVPVIEALHTSSLKLNATASSFYNDLKVLSGAGKDDIATGKKNDWIDAGAGNDTIKAGDGDNTIYGGTGSDSISTGEDEDWIDAGAGNDIIDAGDGENTIFGGTGNDTITSGEDDDWIDAGAGNDVIKTGDKDDTILGGAGSDMIDGGEDDGDRVIYAGSRSEYQVVKLNNDPEGYQYSVTSTDGSVDKLKNIEELEFADSGVRKPSEWVSNPVTPPPVTPPVSGSDPEVTGVIIDRDDPEDRITTGAGNDTISTGDKDDWVDAGAGNDIIRTGDDDDIILGGAGSDKIDGGKDDDRVIYAGNRSEYQVVELIGDPEYYKYSVTSIDGSVDKLKSIELIEFADLGAESPGHWASTQGQFPPATAEQSYSGAQRTYAAGFVQPEENAPPELTLTAAEHSYAGAQQADAVGFVHAEDVDSPELGGATITLFQPQPGDKLDLDGFILRNEDGRTMIGDTGIEMVGGAYASGSTTLTLSGHAPPETYAAVLQSLVLESGDGSSLTPGTRSIGVTLVDSAGAASTQKIVDIVIDDTQPTAQSDGEGFAAAAPPQTMQGTAGTDILLLMADDGSWANNGGTGSWVDQTESSDAPDTGSYSATEFDQPVSEPIQPLDDFQTELGRVNWS